MDAHAERYIHSYEAAEQDRLVRQGEFLAPWVQPGVDFSGCRSVLELGCGVGAQLRVLLQRFPGVHYTGVDISSRQLGQARRLLAEPLDAGRAELVEASAYRLPFPDGHFDGACTFWVLEHLADHGALLREALRVLKPGGLLIMETPNPENLVVATRNFYLDPTHQRPIPSPLLAFVAEHAGFARVKTLRLQESRELVNRGDVSLRDVIAGASPDYAVIAQKHAPDDVLSLISDPFGIDYGLSLDDLVNRWDKRFYRLEAKAEQAEAKAEQAEVALQAIYNSRSWRLTAPLRTVMNFLARGLRK